MVIIHPQDAYGCHKVQERKKILESPTSFPTQIVTGPSNFFHLPLAARIYSVRNMIILSFFVVCFWK